MAKQVFSTLSFLIIQSKCKALRLLKIKQKIKAEKSDLSLNSDTFKYYFLFKLIASSVQVISAQFSVPSQVYVSLPLTAPGSRSFLASVSSV